MSQDAFVRQHEKRWIELEKILDALETPELTAPLERFPERYRELTAHLALAAHRGYSQSLVERLNGLALRGYRHLYPGARRSGLDATRFLGGGYARMVRAELGLLLASTLLFYGVALIAGLLVWRTPDLVYSMVGTEMVENIDRMYDPSAEHFLKAREVDSDVLMFGFYINNNIGIAFRTFAAGAPYAVGTIFFLAYNGLILGALGAHVTQAGYAVTFWPYVIGHGAFELTAIILSGQAGLKLGRAVLNPGRRTRWAALAAEARSSLGLIYGFAGMLVIAAFIEAFWSSSVLVPWEVKVGVGTALWTMVLGYFALAGRWR